MASELSHEALSFYPRAFAGSHRPAAARRGKVDPGAARNAALASASKFGISGPHLAQFMAQIDHESGGFKSVEENLNILND